jgi:hypothetical protein
VSITETLEQIWNTILEVTALFVLPDWGSLFGIMLPYLVLLGVVGPLLTFTVLGILAYQISKPRTKVVFVEGPRVPELDAGGEPIFPAGLPFCRRDALIYPSGTTDCARCGDELSVICPMCSLGRSARIDTCTNCGLVLKVVPHAVAVRPSAGPKPGGAAVA